MQQRKTYEKHSPDSKPTPGKRKTHVRFGIDTKKNNRLQKHNLNFASTEFGWIPTTKRSRLHRRTSFLARNTPGWLSGWLAGWLTDWLVGWLPACLAGWLPGWLPGLFGWLAGPELWQIGCMEGWLAAWAAWLAGWLAGPELWLGGWLAGWQLAGWLAGELAGWLAVPEICLAAIPGPALG